MSRSVTGAVAYYVSQPAPVSVPVAASFSASLFHLALDFFDLSNFPICLSMMGFGTFSPSLLTHGIQGFGSKCQQELFAYDMKVVLE